MDLSSMSLMDLHNHTLWSDGMHSSEKIIENSIKHNVLSVGISDHFDTLKCNSIRRIDLNEYIRNINKLKEKYKDKIHVLTGIEISMTSDLCDLKKLPYDELNKLDYVLLEYIDCFKNSIKLSEIHKYTSKFTCRVGLAHMNLLRSCKIYGTRFIINCLKENNLFWELNINEGYEYFNELVESIDTWKTSRFLKELKNNDIRMSVGSDTHCLDYYDIEKLQIGNMIANHIPIKMLKYDYSISKAMHCNKGLTHYGL